MPVVHTREVVRWGSRVLPHSKLTWGQSSGAGLGGSLAVVDVASPWGGSMIITAPPGSHRGKFLPGQDFPAAGQKIAIDLYYGEKKVKELTGLVDEVSYTQDEVQLSFVSEVDRFSQTVMRLPPLAERMPSPIASDVYMSYPKPSPLWYVNECFRASRFHVTPPRPPHGSDFTLIDLTMQGSVWANSWQGRGRILQCNVYEDVKRSRPPVLTNLDGMHWMNNGVVLAAPQIAALPGKLRLSFMAHRSLSAPTAILLKGNDGAELLLTITAGRELRLTEGERLLLNIPTGEWAEDEVVSLLIWNGEVRLKTASARERKASTGFRSVIVTMRITSHLKSYIAGVALETPTMPEHRVLGFKRSGFIHSSAWTERCVATPSVRDRIAREVLNEIAEATLSTWWVDGEGNAHFASADYLQKQAVTSTLHAPDKVASYNFSDSLLRRRSFVTVSLTTHALSVSNTYSVNLWAWGGQMDAGSTSETFFGPEADSEWLEPQTWLNRIPTDETGYSTGRGSWYGLSKGRGDKSVWASNYTTNVREITPWRWVITEYSSEQADRSVAEVSSIPAHLKKQDLPVIRGKGLIQRARQSITKQVPGVESAPSLSVDTHDWVDRPEVAESMASWLSSQLARALPALKQLVVAYQPALGLHQVIQVRGADADGGRNLLGGTYKALIVGVSHSPDEGRSTLDLVVLSKAGEAPTWAEVEATAQGFRVTWASSEERMQKQGLVWGEAEKNYMKVLGG